MPLFAIGVFVGFTIAQGGMVRHWRLGRGPGWRGKALLNSFGALLTGVSTVVVTASKVEGGARLVVVMLPLLVAAFVAVHRAYDRIDERLGLGRIPEAPHREHWLREAEPERLWQRLLQSLRGAVVPHAVRQETDAVICQLCFRLL